MNRDDMIDVLGQIDDTMIQTVEKMRTNKRRRVWTGWTALAACIAVLLSIGWFSETHFQREKPVEIELNVIQLIYVNHIQYGPDAESSQTATEENVGDFVGMVSLDNEQITRIKAFAYMPDDGTTNRIIVPYKDAYFVYEFSGHYPDGSDEWPADLLKDAVQAEIRDADYWTNKIVYATISNPDVLGELAVFLADLRGKHTFQELNQYYFDSVKGYFEEGQIWINEFGNVATDQNAFVSKRFHALVQGDGRMIVVILRDNTTLTYSYKEGVGVILCHDFGYILTDEQVEKSNHLVGLE